MASPAPPYSCSFVSTSFVAFYTCEWYLDQLGSSEIDHIRLFHILSIYILRIVIRTRRVYLMWQPTWTNASNSYISLTYCHRCDSSLGMSKFSKYLPATRICWSFGISSQSKQQSVSPVKNRVPFSANVSSNLYENESIEIPKCLIVHDYRKYNF